MQKFKYYTLDVFTDRPFGGNPLAVFTDAATLDTTMMQQIATELNLSETVFITGEMDAGRVPVRIFTPTTEIPFAGHPTVGTALLLDKLGWLSAESERVVLQEGIGDVSVVLDRERAVACFQTAQLPRVNTSGLSRMQAAELLGLRPEQVVAEPVIGDCGLPFQLIELKDLAAVSEAELDLTLWRRYLRDAEACSVYLFCRQGLQADIRARMFDPGFNIPEDPATGSAAAALAGTLAITDSVSGEQHYLIEQGVEMGRPSYITTRVVSDRAGVEAVYVSGQAVLMSEGSFLLPGL
ncbi:PhzF family phenazine biosynthesis protein [Marinobacterium jannaschii]|uniref:PhzF family phenazine biosynthesis protein n=1 Tax=Marinobacterium jannaschii TaxID=64970 RepID=UPI000486B0ED|nr:PhzF family phenazine biosynthesis protein [Marinobacterium jannaschii]